MRSTILAVVGLILGVLGALGYSRYFGEGKQVADLQDQIAKLQAELASAKDASRQAKSETDALSTQVQQLIASKDQLQKQVGDGAQNPAVPSFPGLPNMNKADMSGIVQTQMKQMQDQRLRLLIARLHLTPDQVAQIQAAMDAESKRTEEMTEKMLGGQKADFKSLLADAKNTKSVEQTIQDILGPEQKTAYKQMQADQKTAQAESTASMEMNQVAPMLNLNDTQKDQVESALYQVQLDAGNPSFSKKYPTTPGDPLSFMDAQEKAKEDALASILTPEQMATYKQQAEEQLNTQRTMLQKFMPKGGFAAMLSGATNATSTTTPAASSPTSAPDPSPTSATNVPDSSPPASASP